MELSEATQASLEKQAVEDVLHASEEPRLYGNLRDLVKKDCL